MKNNYQAPKTISAQLYCRPISALSIIKGQLNHLDTSIYEVKKFETTNNVTDSAYLKQDEIRKFAQPFLSLPEIADEGYYEKYTEDKVLDAQQNILNITTIDKSDTTKIFGLSYIKQFIFFIVILIDPGLTGNCLCNILKLGICHGMIRY